MVEKKQNSYMPDYVSPPGETLQETLDAIGMSQAKLAERTGRPKKTINEIIKGKVAITPETALQLERVLGVPASFWNNRERHYREHIARIEEQERLEGQIDVLNKFPVRSMARMGWIESFKDKVQQLQEVLNFFGIASPDQIGSLWEDMQAAFRISTAFQIDRDAVIAWLRKGEINAQNIFCKPFDKKKFLRALLQVRRLTGKPPEVFQDEMERICAQAGVAVTFVPELPRTRVSGASRWLTPRKALIQLSLRYKANDRIWFTFFHEAGHIYRHGKTDSFVDFDILISKDSKEKEADEFAMNILIPRAQFRKFIQKGKPGRDSIVDFATELGIAPGIVVGRLQHEEILGYNEHNDLKEYFEWA